VSSARFHLPFIVLIGCGPQLRPAEVPRADGGATSVLARMCRTYEVTDVYADSETLVRHDSMRSTIVATTMMKRSTSRFQFETNDYRLLLRVPIRFATWSIDGQVQARDPDGAVKKERSIEDALDALRGVSGLSSWLVPMLLMSPQAFPCHDANAELLGHATVDGQDSFKVRLVWHSKLVVILFVDVSDFTINAWSLAHIDQPEVPFMDATVTSDMHTDITDRAFNLFEDCHYSNGAAQASQGCGGEILKRAEIKPHERSDDAGRRP